MSDSLEPAVLPPRSPKVRRPRCHRLHHADAPLAWSTGWIIHPIDAALFAACAVGGGLIAGAGATHARRGRRDARTR